METCTLCEQVIPEYNPAYNHLQIDETHQIDVCQSCIDKLVKWRQNIFVDLFPTKQAKKWAKR